MVFLFLALLSSASAEMPLPSYTGAVVSGAWSEINRMIEADRLDEAIAAGDLFRSQVRDDPSIAYLQGLAWRLKGDTERAQEAYETALKLDPTLEEAWSDLGELHLLNKRYREAERAFVQVSELVPSGRYAWLGPFRLAEVAAFRGDAATMEMQLGEAVHRGFSFRTIQGDPNWIRFYADPRLRPTVQKMVGVHGGPAVLHSLEGSADPPFRGSD